MKKFERPAVATILGLGFALAAHSPGYAGSHGQDLQNAGWHNFERREQRQDRIAARRADSVNNSLQTLNLSAREIKINRAIDTARSLNLVNQIRNERRFNQHAAL